MSTAGRALPLALIVLSGTVGCTREARVSSGIGRVGEIGPDAVEGIVRRVGNAPFTRTLVEGDEGIVIAGPYEPEVRRLVGAEIRVTGRLAAEGEFPGPTLEAMSYEIVSVDGERPSLGVLKRDEDGFYLEMRGGSILRLASVSGALAASVGGLVWVILDVNDGVARYGILREPLTSGGT